MPTESTVRVRQRMMGGWGGRHPLCRMRSHAKYLKVGERSETESQRCSQVLPRSSQTLRPSPSDTVGTGTVGPVGHVRASDDAFL